MLPGLDFEFLDTLAYGGIHIHRFLSGTQLQLPAMSNDLGLGAFAKTVLPYPTRSEFLRRMADEHNRGRLTPAARRLFGAWFKWNTRA